LLRAPCDAPARNEEREDDETSGGKEMSKEECGICEYDETCFYLLKAKQRLTKEPCGNFRKKRENKPPKVKPNAPTGTDNTVA
jgi:hypothetical protein